MSDFVVFLVKELVITPVQAVEAYDRRHRSRPQIGQLALRRRKLSVKMVFDILAYQAQYPLRFGEIAVRLGYLSEDEVRWLLEVQESHVRPIPEILVEMGAATAAQLERAFRVFSTSKRLDAHV